MTSHNATTGMRPQAQPFHPPGSVPNMAGYVDPAVLQSHQIPGNTMHHTMMQPPGMAAYYGAPVYQPIVSGSVAPQANVSAQQTHMTPTSAPQPASDANGTSYYTTPSVTAPSQPNILHQSPAYQPVVPSTLLGTPDTASEKESRAYAPTFLDADSYQQPQQGSSLESLRSESTSLYALQTDFEIVTDRVSRISERLDRLEP